MLASDYDGTLAPIVPDPAAARPDPTIVSLLDELSRRLQAIAIISGRDVAQIASFLPVPALHLIGNHGLEWREGNVSHVVAEARPFLSALAQAKDRLLDVVSGSGVTLEVKQVGLSIHFRQAPDPMAAARALEPRLRALAAELELVLHPGRMVWELRPPVSLDKGEALRRLADQLHPQGMIYMGDDVTDQAAFEMLARLPPIRSLRVGVTSGEVNQETFAACDVLVDGVAGVRGFLRALVEHS